MTKTIPRHGAPGAHETRAHKGGPARTGTLDAYRDAAGKRHYRGRIRLADGSRFRLDVPDGMSEAKSREFVAAIQEREDKHGALLAKKMAAGVTLAPTTAGETCDDWHDRFLAQKECGEGHRRVTGSAWMTWISPIIGEKPIAALTRDDLEDVRDHLDRALTAGRIRASTAANAWSALTSAMRGAYAGKDRSLRAHAVPIAAGILPPRGGLARQRPWMYPTEFLTLAACEAVPLEWRLAYAWAAYTGLRPNELRALTWADVDVDAGVVRVSRAWDPEAGEVKAPKTAEGRRTVPLRPELAAALTPGRACDLVAPVHWRKVAERFRAHLRLAGVNRPRLFASSETEEEIDFRSLRDTFATWRVLSGVDPLTLRRELGHVDLATTDLYVKEGAGYRVATLGAPFPSLPIGPGIGPKCTQVRVTMAPTAGLESSQARDTTSLYRVSESSPSTEVTPIDAQVREVSPVAQRETQRDDALERALTLAAEAGRWDVVALLAKELEARRIASAGNVVPIGQRVPK